MKLCIKVFNKPEVLTAFFLEALKVGEMFECRLDITPQGGKQPEVFDFLEFIPIRLGAVAELEVTAQGGDPMRALEAVRCLIESRFKNEFFQLN